jgi:hypothetical protein
MSIVPKQWCTNDFEYGKCFRKFAERIFNNSYYSRRSFQNLDILTPKQCNDKRKKFWHVWYVIWDIRYGKK